MKQSITFNNNKWRGISIALLVGMILPGTGCKKLVAVDPPSDRIVTPVVFNDPNTATQAVLGMYGIMGGGTYASSSFNMSYSCGLLSDELRNYSTANNAIALYTNAMSHNDDASNRVWTTNANGAYNLIYRANEIIESLEKSTGVKEAVKMQLSGEAKFIRAFWHFYLVNCYGDVPLVTTTDYTVNSTLPRSPKADVYKQIIKDLQEARDQISSDYLDATDTAVTPERLRPTSWAARALLARVFLYTNQYDSAEAEATAVINNTGMFSLVPDLNNVFLANSTEAIWQIVPPLPSTFNTTEGAQYVLISAPDPTLGSNAGVSISDQLMASFETSDNRKTSWIAPYTDGITTYYYPYKYKIRTSPDNNTLNEYTMVLRLAEQYLIRAEARAKNGDLAGAVADLNAIRNRAGLNNYAGAMDAESLLAAILHERQVELFTEWGHRWFDLIRTGNINTVMGAPGNVCQQKGGTWSSSGYQQLFPIPQPELDKDYRLVQNPGY